MSNKVEPSSSDVRDAPQARRYELSLQGEVAGFIDYRDRGEVRELVHTEVRPAHEGQGVGQALAKFALDDARRQGLKVAPSCSFIAAYVQRHPETADLVAERPAR